MTIELNKIYNTDILDGFKLLENNSINLIITSPPYNIGIPYDSWNDKLKFLDYFDWCKKWISECYRVLKDDGRIAINIPFEISNPHDSTYQNRIYISAEYYFILKSVGFNHAGIVRLNEINPQIVKKTAWGSWLSASAPYIYNIEECVLLAYKKQWKRLNSGISTINKNEFLKNVTGRWDYRAETQGLTEANFSLDFPLTAIKMLSYKNDIILDPFSGSATTALACLMTNRNYIGFEISEKYWKIGNLRLQHYINKQNCSLKEFL